MEFWGWVIAGVLAFWWFRHRAAKAREAAEQKQPSIPLRVSKTFPDPTTRDDDAVAPAAKDTSPPRWIPAGQAITIGGIHIPGGMIHVGHMRDRYGHPDLIDPTLKVQSCASLTNAPDLDYWPNYGHISTQARGAYLRWLAEGRAAPEIDVGYVFLFFYGLERRLFQNKAYAEAPVLIAEVERLRAVYGSNHSFRRYSQIFLDAARVISADPSQLSAPDPSPEWCSYLPATVRLGIGALLAEDRPVPADWMLAWYLGHEETRLRTPAQRAFTEFCTLFRKRFDLRYPGGLKVRRPQGSMKVHFQASSGAFNVDLSPVGQDIPDITRLKSPVRKAAEIAEACMVDLDSYSRLLGREPEAVGSLKALALLPADLRDDIDSPELAALTQWLDDMTDHGPAPLPIDDLLIRLTLSDAAPDKVGKALARTLAQSLRLLGYGLDPDVDLGAPTPKPGDIVAIYRLPKESPPEGAFGDSFAQAAAVVGLTALVIHADAVVTPDEEAHLLRSVEDNLHLCPAERALLEARAVRLLAAPPTLAQIRTRLKDATVAERHNLARLALVVAAADGHVAPAEVKLLESIYKHLDLDCGQLYSDVHALGGHKTDEPVIVRPATTGPAGHAIPPPPSRLPPTAPGVVLDMDHVAKVRGDTHEVSALLSGIFGAEEPEPEPTATLEHQEAMETSAYNGLDRRHTALLESLLDRDAWPRGEFEHLCRSLDLLPDGAIEALNEWAFDTFDDPILEDDEPITLNRHLLSQQDPTP